MSTYVRSCLLFTLILTGCGDGVQEDRSVSWSNETGGVSFQHGGDGVFVADKNGKNLQKIYQPEEGVIASSTPEWSPINGQLIYTTARAVEEQPATASGDWAATPTGRPFAQQAAVYTCWLRDEAVDDQQPEPRKLFDAPCGHVGYVAANLAVRWHPDGKRILYIKQVGEMLHGLFEYDLETKQSRSVFPHQAEALIFDLTPKSRHLICVVGSQGGNEESDGIWVRPAGDQSWWHIPGNFKSESSSLLIERLRASRPTWGKTGEDFAYISTSEDDEHTVQLATLETKNIQTIVTSSHLLRDLHWSPDGKTLGIVEGDSTGAIRLFRKNQLSKPINKHAVRRFVGWDSTGKTLAYTSPEFEQLSNNDSWAFLLMRDPTVRDRVYVTSRNGEEDRDLFHGMRVTFPRWSPEKRKLSLWFTFQPTHRAFFQRFSGGGLLPGDPAAILDVDTGNIQWMAVSPLEEMQIGHYHAIHKDYEQAWQWYEKAAKKLPPPTPPPLLQFFLQRTPTNFEFFQYHCLTKLGRHDEAKKHLGRFRQTYLPAIPETSEDETDNPDEEHAMENLLRPDSFSASLLLDLYMAQAFLSLDAADDAHRFFVKPLNDDASDGSKLSRQMTLAQVLLIQKKRQAYARLVTDSIMPLLLKQWSPEAAAVLLESEQNEHPESQLLVAAAGTTLLPLFSEEFVDTLPEPQLREMAPAWETMVAQADDDIAKLAIYTFLRAAYTRLDQKDELERVEKQITDAESDVLSKERVTEMTQFLRDVR